MAESTEGRVIIDLSADEHQSLTGLLGYAYAAARQQGESRFASSTLRLANAIHRGDPHWTPFEEDPKDAT